MSTKTIGFPSNPSLDQEYQGWVWDGEKWVSDAVKGGLWEQNGDDIYYDKGNVNIGRSDDIGAVVGIGGETITASPNNGLYIGRSGYTTQYNSEGLYATDHYLINTGGTSNTAMTIDADGRVDITGSLYVNGSEVGGGGLPDGDYTHNGKITATDFISTSDERLKDNITPMPIGLIDDIKPVSWDWKDGSGTSAGVVAQQLQAVGLGDYVHENEDGQLGVNYQALTAILLAEVIELKRSLK